MAFKNNTTNQIRTVSNEDLLKPTRLVLETKCLVQRVCIQTAWAGTKTVNEQNVTTATDKNQNKEMTKLQDKYTYIVSATERKLL